LTTIDGERVFTTGHLSKHSARLQFEDRKCHFQFIDRLSNFGVFANLVLQELSANFELLQLALLLVARRSPVWIRLGFA
jgi:hypothetical protein